MGDILRLMVRQNPGDASKVLPIRGYIIIYGKKNFGNISEYGVKGLQTVTMARAKLHPPRRPTNCKMQNIANILLFYATCIIDALFSYKYNYIKNRRYHERRLRNMEVLTSELFNSQCGKLATKLNFNLYDAVLYDNGKVYRYEHQKANACNNSYSVSKMFTMAAIGFLVDDGRLSLDDKVCDILSDEIKIDYHDKWKEVTVRHALGHKMGIDRDDPHAEEEERLSFDTNDFLARVFSEKIIHTPGTFYCYSDGAYYMLSRIVTKISGEKLDDFLIERLFRPLGFEEPAWGKCPYGYPLGGDSLYCRTEDMIKLGIIYLNGGVFEGRRYFSEEWIKTTIRENLGMLPCEKKSHGKTGSRGQIVVFCPETNKALALHAYECDNLDFRGAAIRRFLENEP